MKKLSIDRVKRGTLKLMVLSSLAEKPMYVYEIIKSIYNKTQEFYKPSPGSIYPVLRALIREGLVEVRELDGKKIYKLTEKGLEKYNQIKKETKDFFDSNSRLKKEVIDTLFEIGYIIYLNRDKIDENNLKALSSMLQRCKEEIRKLFEKS